MSRNNLVLTLPPIIIIVFAFVTVAFDIGKMPYFY